jgi:hypothetical protein
MFCSTPALSHGRHEWRVSMKRSETHHEIENIAPARTLADLGVPGPLAMEMEGALRALGGAKRWRVFVTPDGVAHPLRVEQPEDERRRAAHG